jgi:hypothetical protein
MAKLSGLSEYFNPGLELADVPGRDDQLHSYVVPLPSAELGLWCQMMAEAAGRIHSSSTADEMQKIIDLIEEEIPDLAVDTKTMAQRVLGDTYAQMVADGVDHFHIQFCGATAYAWIVGGEEAAERYWKSGGRAGEAPGPANRQERRAAGRTSTASGNATRSRASTRTTKSPSKSPKPTKATASRGRRS